MKKIDYSRKKLDLKNVIDFNKLIGNFVIVLFIFTAIFCSYKLTYHYIEKRHVETIMKDIIKEDTVLEEKDIPITKNDENTKYIDIIKNEKFLNIDFDKLLKKNNETVAWLKVNETNINYPVVKNNENNQYYLNKSFDKKDNSAGWIFMDYRNNISLLNNKNTIIYGHGRNDNIMFGPLNNIFKKDYFNNEKTRIIKVSTPYENSIWKIFSAYTILPETYYIKTDFGNKKSFNTFLETLKQRSMYDFNEDINNVNRILTLSTCYNDRKRTVIHAKLIKIEKINNKKEVN